MAQERTWDAVSALFSANGTVQGLVTVADTTGFYVGMIVLLTSNTQSPLSLKIKRVNGPNEIFVGPTGQGTDMNSRTNVSAFLVSDGAGIHAAEQLKPRIKIEDQEQASYESEPINARRVIPVDTYGNKYGVDNPIPVSSSNGFSPVLFGDVKTTFDANSNPIRYSFYKATVLQGYIVVAYDSNSNAIDYQSYDKNGNPL
jgi:hypothetical protein